MSKIVSTNSNIGLSSTRSPHSGDSPSDYSEIDTTGHFRSNGEATAWIDINFDVLALTLGASSPTLTALSGGTILHPHFSPSVTNAINGAVEIDHHVRIVTLKPHIHWVTTNTNTGNVYWQLTYTVTNSGSVEPTETTIAVATPGSGVTNDNVIAIFPDIDVTGFDIGAQFSFRLFRNPADASDTYTGSAAVKTFGLHAEIQSLGSRDVSSSMD